MGHSLHLILCTDRCAFDLLLVGVVLHGAAVDLSASVCDTEGLGELQDGCVLVVAGICGVVAGAVCFEDAGIVLQRDRVIAFGGFVGDEGELRGMESEVLKYRSVRVLDHPRGGDDALDSGLVDLV